MTQDKAYIAGAAHTTQALWESLHAMTFRVRARAVRLWGLALAPAAVLVLGAAATTAQAGVVDEVRIGALAHDYNDINHGKESGSADILLEVDSKRPQILRVIGAPRLNAVASFNTDGLTNYVAAGLTWDHRLFGPIYGSIDLGMAQTDGVKSPPMGANHDYVTSHRLLLGSKTLFREAIALDWRLNPRWSVGLQIAHLSNGLILSHRYNEGLNDGGIRVSYRLP